jgi:hypothetical protein
MRFSFVNFIIIIINNSDSHELIKNTATIDTVSKRVLSFTTTNI